MTMPDLLDGADVGSSQAEAGACAGSNDRTAESKAVTCQHCLKAFTPRKGTGGKPQRFCGTECRTAFHAEAQRCQRGPTCDAETTLPAATQPPASKAAQAGSDEDGTCTEFDWLKDEGDVVLPSQAAIALYFNRRGDLVIRQEADFARDEDSFVYVEKGNVQAFLDKLCDVCGVGSAGR